MLSERNFFIFIHSFIKPADLFNTDCTLSAMMH